MNKTTHTQKTVNDQLLCRLTAFLLSFAAADAAYILGIVVKMTKTADFAAEQYHSVPLMTEHILAAVVLYLAFMILIHKSQSQ